MQPSTPSPDSTRPAFATGICCPRCHGALIPETNTLRCSSHACGHAYPVVDGRPILIDESASVFRIADYLGAPMRRPKQTRLQSFLLQNLPSLDLNLDASQNVARMRHLLGDVNRRPSILNIGGKHPKAAMAALRRDPSIDCVECDYVPAPTVAVVADPRSLPFAAGAFDAVLLDGVLEHSMDPQRVVDEAHRVLRPEGLVYSDSPFMLPVHGGAYDFTRLSALAHRKLFHRFARVHSGISSGPGTALGHAIQSVALSFVRSRRARFAVKALCRVSLFWIKYVDLLLGQRPAALDGAMGTYFIGRKAAHSVPERELLSEYVGNTPDLYQRS